MRVKIAYRSGLVFPRGHEVAVENRQLSVGQRHVFFDGELKIPLFMCESEANLEAYLTQILFHASHGCKIPKKILAALSRDTDSVVWRHPSYGWQSDAMKVGRVHIQVLWAFHHKLARTRERHGKQVLNLITKLIEIEQQRQNG